MLKGGISADCADFRRFLGMERGGCIGIGATGRLGMVRGRLYTLRSDIDAYIIGLCGS